MEVYILYKSQKFMKLVLKQTLILKFYKFHDETHVETHDETLAYSGILQV
jgi:hypothetical protein